MVLTEREHADLAAKAADLGVSMADYLRLLISGRGLRAEAIPAEVRAT